jgi:hypothetical protein
MLTSDAVVIPNSLVIGHWALVLSDETAWLSPISPHQAEVVVG